MEINQLSLEKFIEGLPIGILILDSSGKFLAGNAKALGLLDIHIEDLLTQSFDSVIADELLQRVVRQILSGEIAKQNALFEKNGKFIKYTLDTIAGESDEDNAVLVIIEDATSYKQLELIKQDFIQTTLHRIRNPLTTLKTSLAMVNTLHRESLPESIREIFDMSYHEVNRLNILMNDLRNLFLIETGLAEVDMEIEQFPVADVLDRVLKELYKFPTITNETKKQISCFGDPDVSIKADFEKVKQVLFILLKNACEFSPDKTPVEIHISRGDGCVTLEIRDSGIGISEETQQSLFTKYFREDNHITRTIDGNGLGLFIARSLVSIMQGTLYCESRQEKGTSFFLTLPSE